MQRQHLAAVMVAATLLVSLLVASAALPLKTGVTAADRQTARKTIEQSKSPRRTVKRQRKLRAARTTNKSELWATTAVGPETEVVSLPQPTQAELARVFAPVSRYSGMIVVDAKSGKPLYQRDPKTSRKLASNTKLFVAGTSLRQLRSELRSKTLRRVLGDSDNARAQQLYQYAGGASTVEHFSSLLGARVDIHDGSGLDPRNRAAPAAVARFLVAMRLQPQYRRYKNALAVTGRTGTLRKRMRGTAAAGRCHAKTGTLVRSARVIALSGYCTTVAGREIVFSILLNGASSGPARKAIDKMVNTLVAGY